MKQVHLRGYIAIMTVLALLVFSLSLLISVPYLSIGGIQEAAVFSESETVYAALEGCAEDALLLSARDENYTGGTYTYLGATCEVSIEKNDPLWTLSFTGSRYSVTRVLRVIVERTPGTPGTLTLQSWLEE
jgi:hypothetical protein